MSYIFEVDRKDGVDAAWEYLSNRADIRYMHLKNSWLVALFFGFLLGMIFGHHLR
jgi:hypothetical protein